MSNGSVNLPIVGGGGTATDLNLPITTSPTVGTIQQNSAPLLSTYGDTNLFIGPNSGNFTLTGNNNIGLGANTLEQLTSGQNNLAIGQGALDQIQNGSGNIGIGQGALGGDGDGNVNTSVAIGWQSANGPAGPVTDSVFIGSTAGAVSLNLNSALSCTFLGANTDSNAGVLTNSIAIGANAVVDDDNTCQIGDGALAVINTAAQVRASSLGVGNSQSATIPGAVVRKVELFDVSGSSLGFVALYSSIT